jgi:ABC-type transporter Mla maintaining outer membrane lipid asymmetry permease subunit MlaE
MLTTHFLVALILCVLSATFAQTFFDYSAEDAYGNVVSMSKYKDAKVLLIGELFFASIERVFD